MDEQRYTLGLVYKANVPDAHGEYATPEDLRAAAWDYAVNGREVGLYHVDGTTGGSGVPVESYIYQGPDWVIKAVDGSTVTITEGDWLMGVVWSPGAWQLIKSGRVNGLSMQGVAYRRAEPIPAVGGDQ